MGLLKNERESIAPDELVSLREIGAAWLAAGSSQIDQALADGVLQEINDEEES